MKIRPLNRLLFILPGVLATVFLLGAADGSWLSKVPDTDRTRANPMASQPDAVAAGAKLYRNNCAQCHGPDGNGRGRRPALRSPRVIAATDGELAWMLRNGSPWSGMPGWAKLPEPQRWQIIAYLRTMQPAPSEADSAIPGPLPPAGALPATMHAHP
jgi:mono/diheme cytochrome c family protein